MKKLKIVQNKPTVKENTPVSVGLNMDQTDAVYKVLEDNFGEEHIKDMFTLGSLSLYNMLVKGGVAGIQETVNEQPDVLNKIADMFDRKYPHLKFDVNTMFDRIDVSGNDQDVFTFGEELAGQKIFDYEITTIDKEGRNYEVRIVRSDSIVRNAVNPTNEEKPGLWANIRAKQERGEKPARKGSKAYKIAKKAGDEINKEK